MRQRNYEFLRKNNGTVPENVSRIIKEKGLKHSFVAAQSGLTPNRFSDLINGRKVIRAVDIAAIADALEVTPNDLFGIPPPA